MSSQQGCDCCDEALGENHPLSLALRAGLATRQANAGNTADSLAAYRKVLAGREAALGPNDPATLSTLINLGTQVLIGEQDKGQAVSLLQRAYDGCRQQYGPDDKNTRAAQIWLEKAKAADFSDKPAVVMLTGTRPNYAEGAEVSVRWAVTSGQAGVADWIGLYPVSDCGKPQGGVCPTGSLAWFYLNSQADVPAARIAGPGSVTLTLPIGTLSPCVQYALYYCLNGGYDIAGMSLPFTVGSPVTISGVSNPSYFVGETITATWTNAAPVGASDWIGLYAVSDCGACPGGRCPVGSLAWVYLSGTQSKPATAPASPGIVSLVVPSGLTAGVRYALFYCLNDDYEIAGMSQAFTAGG